MTFMYATLKDIALLSLVKLDNSKPESEAKKLHAFQMELIFQMQAIFSLVIHMGIVSTLHAIIAMVYCNVNMSVPMLR